MNGACRELAAIFLGAEVGRKFHVDTPPVQLLRQCGRGKEMTTRAPGREQDRRSAHAACSFGLARAPGCSAR